MTVKGAGPVPTGSHFVPYVLGTALLALAGGSALFALYAALLKEPPGGFLAALIVAATVGALLRSRGSAGAEPSTKEALVGVLLTWSLLPAVSALPYVLSGGLTPVAAFFEAMSGFTTTGATTLSNPLDLGASLVMWRAASQWVGGIGIVVLFVAVFPQLAIAGRQLFFAEVPGVERERLTPRLQTTALLVLSLYSVLTVLAVTAFALTGMGFFDATAYALASVAAGGFSPTGEGLGGYGVAAQWVAIVFMLLAGVSFPVLYRAVMGRPFKLLKNAEFRAYLGIVLVSGVALAWSLGPSNFLESIRHGLFQAVSLTTSTGFTSTDYSQWSVPAQVLLTLLLFVGGSAGSASGGVKVIRWLIIFKHAAREVRRALHPRAVMPVRLGARVVPEEVIRSVSAFLLLFMTLFVAGAVALVFLGEEPRSALVLSISSLGNTGTGPLPGRVMGAVDSLHPAGLGVLTFLMYAGRLEVVTVLVLLDRSFWRRSRRASRGHP